MANFRENLRLSEFRVVQSLWSVQRPERDSVYHMPNSWLISEKISGYLSSLICLFCAVVQSLWSVQRTERDSV